MKFSRRSFLGGSCALVGSFSLAGTVAEMSLMTKIASAQSVSDYKALVCLFLAGGNDGYNTIVRTDGAGYGEYSKARSGLAIPQGELLKINKTSGGMSFGLHPSMPRVQQLINQNAASMVFNVGTLIGPLNKSNAEDKSLRPTQLFSHPDQQLQWQTSVGQGDEMTGWGGRIGDALRSINDTSGVSSLISLSGSNVFQIGQYVTPFVTGGKGGLAFDLAEGSIAKEAIELAQVSRGNLMERAYNEILIGAKEGGEILQQFLDQGEVGVEKPGNNKLGGAIESMVKIMRGSKAAGVKRQIFFLKVGGYDTHGGQLNQHANKLAELDAAIGYFYDAVSTVNLLNEVTLFTASDFGRTLSPNSGGTDHGWGGHHFVVGGAVKGGLYGKFPVLLDDGPDSIKRGRLIPQYSVDQYAATLASWLGVPDGELVSIFPNLVRFNERNLGFV